MLPVGVYRVDHLQARVTPKGAVKCPGQPQVLIVDRTHWWLGRTDLNVLGVGLVYQGGSILLAYQSLQKPGQHRRTQAHLDQGVGLPRSGRVLLGCRSRVYRSRLVGHTPDLGREICPFATSVYTYRISKLK